MKLDYKEIFHYFDVFSNKSFDHKLLVTIRMDAKLMNEQQIQSWL